LRTKDTFGQLLRLSDEEVCEFTDEIGTSGPFSIAYYYKNVLKKWDKKTIKQVKLLSVL
jgi:hypothetical protein